MPENNPIPASPIPGPPPTLPVYPENQSEPIPVISLAPPGFTPPPLVVRYQPSRSRWIWFVVVLVLTGVGAIVAVVANRTSAPRTLPPRESLSSDQKHALVSEIFSGPDANLNTPAAHDVAALLNRLVKSNVPSSVSVESIFDIDRMCDELDRVGAFTALAGEDKSGFLRGFKQGAAGKLGAQFLNLGYDSIRIKRIQFSSDGKEAVAYLIAKAGTADSDVNIKQRIWMYNSGDGWRFWDSETLETGQRVSGLMALALQNMTPNGNIPNGISQAGPLISKATASLRADRLTSAKAALGAMDLLSMPAELDSVRLYLHAAYDVKNRDFKAALEDCSRVDSTGQDVPGVFMLRTEAYNGLNDSGNALRSADAWQKSLGDEPLLEYERAIALQRQGQKPAALSAIKSSLDQEPDDSRNLSMLAGLLPKGTKKELAERFARCSDQATIFRLLAGDLERKRELEALADLVDAYKLNPAAQQDHWFVYYSGEVDIFARRFTQAMQKLQTLLPFCNVKGQELFEREYLYACYCDSAYLQGYQTDPNKKLAFKLLSTRLIAAGQFDQLAPLIEAHAVNFPGDPELHYCKARLANHERDFTTADAEFALAQTSQAPADRDRYLASRVTARYNAGQGLQAYQQLFPRDQVYIQLARLMTDHRQGPELAQLNNARLTDSPQDPMLPGWQAEAKYLAGDYPGTVDLIDQHRDALEPSEDWVRFRRIYVRAQVRLKNFDSAIHQARQTVDNQPEWYMVAVAECAAGHVQEGTEALDRVLRDPENYTLQDIYTDNDLGKALQSTDFADWRTQHPYPPASQPTLR